MTKKPAKTRKPNPPKKKPAKLVRKIMKEHEAPAAKLTPVEELHDALHALVVAAESYGDRDRPEVVAARVMLQKHEKSKA